MKRVGNFLLVIQLLLFTLFFNAPNAKASSGCTLCILEFGTASDLGEVYDFVIIGNASASSMSLSSIQLQYFNSLGVFDSRINLSGTLTAGQTKVFTSSELKTYNPSASSLSFSIFSGGGSLKLIKILTASTTEYDTVGWGESAVYETKAIDIEQGTHFIRLEDELGSVIDTNDNSLDFSNAESFCEGVLLNEIQPFATDVDGKTVESWVEVLVEKIGASECAIATSEGKYYVFDSSSLGGPGAIVAISSVMRGDIEEYLQLQNPSGSAALAGYSKYSATQPVLIPISEITYSNLEKAQSYGLFEEYGSNKWQATYIPTPNEQNILQTTPPKKISGDPLACSNILINELSPNPVGSDTNQEWIEIKNNSDSAQNLEQCVIEIEAEKYYFLAGSMIGPNAIQRYDKLYGEDGDEKTIALRNSDETYVGLYRLYADELTLLQSFTYSDAPEGMSYARFDEGWAWTYAITPGASNVYQATKPAPSVTELKASFVSSVAPTASVVKVASTAKKTTSSKALATKAKTTTGVKNVDTRDVYEEPFKSELNDNNNYVFIVIGVLAILYALYEYKIDIQNFYLKWRRNKELGSANRPVS